MRTDIIARVCEEAQYIIENEATTRQTGRVFGVNKTTVHNDMVRRLPKLDLSLASRVRVVLEKNKQERAMRGGLATKAKRVSRKGE